MKNKKITKSFFIVFVFIVGGIAFGFGIYCLTVFIAWLGEILSHFQQIINNYIDANLSHEQKFFVWLSVIFAAIGGAIGLVVVFDGWHNK
jgi:hypothetical protein